MKTDSVRYPKHCALCDSDSFTLVTNKLRYPYPGGVFRCNSCNLVFLYPGMDAEQEKIFYEKEYGDIFSTEKGTTPQALFHARLPDAEMYYNWIEPWIKKTDTCLEIGCASGYFLSILKNHVREVAGIESHRLLRSFCTERGFLMFETIDECPDCRFDVVFLFFVLEHLGDPLSFLSSIRRILQPGGTLIVVVPNVDDALLRLYDIPEIIPFYYTPAHQFYYNRDTLQKLMNTSGNWKDCSVVPIQRYDLSNHMHWMQERKPGGQGRYNEVFSEDLLFAYAQCLTKTFLCDTLLLKAVAKKD